ncbi:shikimate kinase [Vicingaceae bacterium]|nr:shikimate kinase [Vicingaceae bacterium]MDC1451129.1 shikimate kinase [Vicingaceae bacterium]
MNYPIFIIGFMASGKTLKGKELSRKLNVSFVDLDHKIELQKNQTISSIFENHGEEHFRKVEAETLRSIPKQENAIIALGGGTPCFHNNMSYINEFGTTVYLKRSESIILGRLRQSKQKRPLVANLSDQELKSFITKILGQRARFYEKAQIVFDADNGKMSDLLQTLQE